MRLRFTTILAQTLLCCLLLFLAGCSGSSNGSPTQSTIGTGAIAVKVAVDNVNAQKSAVASLTGVTKVQLSVSGPGMTPITKEFPVDDRKGTIEGVPAGAERKLQISGLNGAGALLYSTYVRDLTVQDGKTTDAGTVTMGQNSYLQYRTMESGSFPYGHIETDTDNMQGMTLKDASGTLIPITPSLQKQTWYSYDCVGSSCYSDATFFIYGYNFALQGTSANIPAGNYTAEAPNAAGGSTVTTVSYPGSAASVPAVSSSSMSTSRSASDITFTWQNPTSAAGWSRVNQLRLLFLDSSMPDKVLQVYLKTSAQSVTVPLATITQAGFNVDSSTLTWQMHTRNTQNGNNIGRGVSNNVPVSSALPTYSISGKVTSNSAGLAGVRITAGNYSATTLSDGSFTITGVPNGSYSLIPSLSGYTFSPASTPVTVGNVNITGQNFTASTSVAVNAAAVQGVVINLQDGSAIPGATVNAFTLSNAVSPVATATTDANGNFSIPGLVSGTNYTYEFSKSGFTSLQYYNIVPTTSVLVLEAAKLTPSALQPQTATASGKIVDASTNIGLTNMTIKLRSGITNRSGSIVATATTDSTGMYSFANLAAGTYSAEVSGNIGTTSIITSYYTLFSIPGSTSANSNQNFPVTTPLTSTGSGQYRIVLNWGNNPSDLDSYLTGPASGGTRFRIYFGEPDYPMGSTTYGTSGNQVAGPTTEAFLDIDNTSHGYNNGPETTTIVVPRTGTYKFYVNHFGGTGSITTSGAQVKVYKGSALLATFNPPNSLLGENAIWSVFSMDVTANGETIMPVNTISMISPYSLAKIPETEIFEYWLFKNLRSK